MYRLPICPMLRVKASLQSSSEWNSTNPPPVDRPSGVVVSSTPFSTTLKPSKKASTSTSVEEYGRPRIRTTHPISFSLPPPLFRASPSFSVITKSSMYLCPMLCLLNRCSASCAASSVPNVAYPSPVARPLRFGISTFSSVIPAKKSSTSCRRSRERGGGGASAPRARIRTGPSPSPRPGKDLDDLPQGSAWRRGAVAAGGRNPGPAGGAPGPGGAEERTNARAH